MRRCPYDGRELRGWICSIHGYVGPARRPSLAKRQNAMMTPEGGLAVLLKNDTGAATVRGYVVHNSLTTAMGVELITINDPDPIGVFYETGVEDGDWAWVVVSGIAEVYYVSDVDLGDYSRGFVTGEGAYVLGQALAEGPPSSPFATDKHFCEIGHALESRTGAGLAKTLLHFN